MEEVGDFVFEGGEFDEGEGLLLWMQVVYYLQVHLLQDDVQLVQDFLLHLVENVLAHLHHN